MSSDNKIIKGNKKIVQLNRSEPEVIELNEEELELKKKLMEIDDKINSVHKVMESMSMENKDSIYVDEVMEGIIGLASVAATTSIIADYFGVDSISLDNILM